MVRAEPTPVSMEKVLSLLYPAGPHQLRETALAPSSEKDQSLRVPGQVLGVEPRVFSVHAVGQGEQPGEVGISLSGAHQKDQPRVVCQGQFPAGYRLYSQTVGQAGELQSAAQVGVGQGHGRIAALLGGGQKFVDV